MLNQMTIKNYKCFVNLSISLNQMTILTGSNSAGKSSVIQSILLTDIGVKNQEKKIYTNNVFGVDLGIASKLVKQVDYSKEEVEEDIESDVEFSFNDNSFIIELNTSDKNEENFFDIESTGSWDFNLFYLNAERTGPRVANSILDSSSVNAGYNGENAGFMLEKLKNEVLSMPENLDKALSKKFYDICIYWLNQIIPESNFSTKSDTDLGVSAVRFNKNFVPTAVGFGLSYILSIIVQGLYCASLVEQGINDIVLIIENPEAHLHPSSQSKMGMFLSELSMCGVQIILETHSEHIINGSRLNLALNEKAASLEIHFFNEGTVEKISVDELGELSHWPTGFFDQNINDIRELLKNKQRKLL